MHLDCRVQGGMQLRSWFGILFRVLVDFGKIDGWVSCSSGWCGRILPRLTAGFYLGRSSGGAFGGAGAQALSGVYAVFVFCQGNASTGRSCGTE